MPVIAFADHRIRNRIQNPRPFAASSLVKISWILFQQRRENCTANQRTSRRGRVCRSIAFCISLCALPITRKIILRLLYARDCSRDSKSHRINHRSPGQLKFLLGRKWRSVGNIADIVIRDEAERPLLLLFLNLFFRYFHLRWHHRYLRVDGGQRQRNLWNKEVLLHN